MSQEKRKNLNHQDSQLTLKNHNPGCMWGILHHLQHNRWHNVVKRLPRKRLIGSGKHSSSDQGRILNTSDAAAKLQENIDSSIQNPPVEPKAIVPPSPAHKSSMKSRIKALITDEMYRRKGRHNRSSTYPIRKPLDSAMPAVHSIESPPQDNSNDNSSSPHQDHSMRSTASLDDPPLPKICDENSNNHIGSCELCDTMLKVNYLKQNEVNKLGKQPVRDHTVLHGNSIYAVEPRSCDAIQESKLFMDALDLLNVREEVFLKILQDPTSSLAHQLHFRQTPNKRFGLTKSVSFAASERRDYRSESSSMKQEDESQNHIEYQTGENDSPAEELSEELEPNLPRKKNENKVVIKSFKNIGTKIKHVIRDKKKEKNRIIKDAVHHKIPCDRSVSKNDSELGSDFGKTSAKSFKRTSSLNDSFDRYNQLLEISINNEAEDHVSDRLRFKPAETQPPVRKTPAKLGRIFSLPDLRSYSSTQIDDSASNSPLIASETVVVNEQKLLDLGSKSEPQICSMSESGSQDNLLDHLGELPSKLDEISENDCEYLDDEFVHEIEVYSVLEPSLLFPSEEDDLYYSDSLMVPQNTAGAIDTQESLIQQVCNDLMQIHQVDTKNEAEYDYVRDVLDRSGFCRDAILGRWYSSNHRLNPTVSEQVEGNSDHVLLLDTINEVLLGIHDRSFCYWPRTLTSLSRVHQPPKGDRVLDEVWAEIRWLLMWRPEVDQAIDEAVSRDVSKHDGWMNLQLDSECVGLKLEDVIFDDLLDEIIAEW